MSQPIGKLQQYISNEISNDLFKDNPAPGVVKFLHFSESTSSLRIYLRCKCWQCTSNHYRDVCLFAQEQGSLEIIKKKFDFVKKVSIAKPIDEDFKQLHQRFSPQVLEFKLPQFANLDETSEFILKHPHIDSTVKGIRAVDNKKLLLDNNEKANFENFLKNHIVIWIVDESTVMVLPDGRFLKGEKQVLQSKPKWNKSLALTKVKDHFAIYTNGDNNAYDFYKSEYFFNV